jgi:hypothetical protein
MCPLLSYMVKNFFLVIFSDHFIFSILLQHRISKLSKYFRSNFLSVQVSEIYKAMLQTQRVTSSMFSLIVKSGIFVLHHVICMDCSRISE